MNSIERQKRDGQTRKPSKLRYTFHLSSDLMERVRDAVYWSPGVTLASFTEEALEAKLRTLQKKQGKVFPKRDGNLQVGRPIAPRPVASHAKV